MAQITYADKTALNINPDVNAVNKCQATDMNEIKSVVNNNTPVGSINLYAGSSAPTGWLICDGSAVSRTTYADLFDVIGTTYGSGDGSTTFNIPNLKGNVPVGLDSNDTDFDTLGETGGEKEHTLTTDEMPSHNHEITIHRTAGAGTMVAQSSGTGGSVTGSSWVIGNTGGGDAHNNLQPYIVLNYIIAY